MIIKFFKRGSVKDIHYSTGGNAAKQYLLGKDYRDGVASREHARLLAGDPDEVTEIINGLEFSKIYTSGCLAFDGIESQYVTEAMKRELMAEFEQCLFTGLDSAQYAGYWVEHFDKLDEKNNLPRLELNFVFANVELTTGKALPVYYHLIDEKRVDTFKEIKNLEMALSDPNAIERKRLTRIKDKLPQNVKDTLADIDKKLTTAFMDESVNNREDVIRYLSEHYEITSIKNQSISIKNPHGGSRPIRLQGAFYEKTFESRGTLGVEFDQTKNHRRHRDHPDSERIVRLKADYQQLCDKRRTELTKRFKKQPPKRATPVVEPANRIESTITRPYRFVYRQPRPHDSVRVVQYQAEPMGATHSHFKAESVLHLTEPYQTNQNTDGQSHLSDQATHTVLPASTVDSGQFGSLDEDQNSVDLSNPASIPVIVHSTAMGDFYGLSDISATTNARGITDVAQSSKPTVRDRLGAALTKIVKRATTAIRDFQTAVRARQSSVGTVDKLARACYEHIRTIVGRRNQQRTCYQHTARQFADTQSAVSRASHAVINTTPSPAFTVPEPITVITPRDKSARPIQPNARTAQSTVAQSKPNLESNQPTVTGGQPSNFNPITALDWVVSRTGQQTDPLDDTIDTIARRQVTLAEQQRQARIKQQLEQRTAFETQIALAIKTYFETLKQAHIEADYDYSRYSLNRALQAVIGLRVSQEVGDDIMFLNASQAYKRAMLGITPTTDELAMMDKARDGSMGFCEKISHHDPLNLGYRHNDPSHKTYLTKGIALAQVLNERAEQLVSQAIDSGFIEKDYPVEPYGGNRSVLTPLVGLFKEVNESLLTVMQSLKLSTLSPQPKPSSPRRGPGF